MFDSSLKFFVPMQLFEGIKEKVETLKQRAVSSTSEAVDRLSVKEKNIVISWNTLFTKHTPNLQPVVQKPSCSFHDIVETCGVDGAFVYKCIAI